MIFLLSLSKKRRLLVVRKCPFVVVEMEPFLIKVFAIGDLLVISTITIRIWRPYSFPSCIIPFQYQVILNETGRTIRESYFPFLWHTREQWHRLMMRWEKAYMMNGWSRCSRSCFDQIGFLYMINYGYLVQATPEWLLSRVTDPIAAQAPSFVLKMYSEGRSSHPFIHSIILRIVSVFLYL